MTEENNLNNALEAIERGIEFQDNDDLEQAAPCYQRAIETIEASEIIENFVIAKTGAIELQFLSGEINEADANRLLEQIKTGYESLKNEFSEDDRKRLRCGACTRRDRDGYLVGRRRKPRCVVCSV